jgi:hypothetical protein
MRRAIAIFAAAAVAIIAFFVPSKDRSADNTAIVLSSNDMGRSEQVEPPTLVSVAVPLRRADQTEAGPNSEVEQIDSTAPDVNAELPTRVPGSPFRQPLDEAYLKREYGLFTDAEINREVDRVQAQWDLAKSQGFDEQFERGSQRRIERGADGKFIFPNLPHGRLYQTKTFADQTGEVFIVDLPFGEYQEAYDLGDRWAWLFAEQQRRLKQ